MSDAQIRHQDFKRKSLLGRAALQDKTTGLAARLIDEKCPQAVFNGRGLAGEQWCATAAYLVSSQSAAGGPKGSRGSS